MAILSSDITYRLSGGAANSDPDASLGGAKSSVEASTNLYDAVSSAEAAAGDVEYRCFYINNGHGSLTYLGARVWIQANTPSATTTIEMGLGTSAVNGTEQTVANESTAPSGVTFSTPTDFSSGLVIGDIPNGQHKAVWIKRTINAGTASATDTATFRVQGDSNP